MQEYNLLEEYVDAKIKEDYLDNDTADYLAEGFIEGILERWDVLKTEI